MDVVELRVGGAMMIMHENQNGLQMMANEVASRLLIQKTTKSSLFTTQDDEVFQVVETASTGASRQALLKPEAAVVGEARYVEEFTARNMRLVSEIHAKEAGDADHFETKCSSLPARKLSCSEEASVDVHLEDSEKDFLKTVSIVDPAQKNSEELAEVPQEVEAEPSLVVKCRSHEVSIDVIIPDGWEGVEAEAEAEVSVAETEVSTSGVAPSLESEKPSPSGRVDVEPVDINLTTEHEAPSTIGVTEQGRELVSKSLGIQVGEESNDADLRPRPSPLTGGESDEPMVWEFVQPTQVETSNMAESFPCTSESTNLDRIAPDVDSNIQHVKSTARVLSFADWERPAEADAGTMVEESTTATPKQSEGIKEQPQRILSFNNLKKRPLVEPGAVSEPAVRPVKPKALTVVGLPWPPMPLISAEEKFCVGTDDAIETTDTEVLESANSPSEGVEASIQEQHRQRLWSSQTLKTRPAVAEPRTITTTQQSSSLEPVKLKAPKVVGLSWPPAPLTTAPGAFT